MKKAIITGASAGIGLDVAKLLAARGYQITLVARREDELKKAQKILAGNGHSILVSDLSDAGDLAELAGHLHVNSYDVLINNAGAGLYGLFTEMSLDDQLLTMKLNMDALVTLSYAFLKNANSGDALVNVASLLAHSSLPAGAVYAATKSFVANFSESLWFEYEDRNIFILGFNPGATRSDFHKSAGAHTASYPDFVLSDSADVADDLLKALERRAKPRVVSGWKNRMMLFGFKFLSRAAAVRIMGIISPGMKVKA